MWRSELQLRFGDIDALGHVTSAAYLVLFEETRSAWMTETLGVRHPSYVVAAQRIEYLHEVRLGDRAVTVELGIRSIGTSSFEVVEHLRTADTLCARSTATLVTWDMELRRPRPIAPDERAMFEAFAAKPE